jgi:peptide chain release factor 2
MMLLRMYSRWCERNGFDVQTLDMLSNEEAGIKYATLHIQGNYAYGFLKTEVGVHRLIRISPFNANNKRHTSFASVDAIPECDEEKINIDEKDFKIETFRAGGPGGQHVNVTSSAVRITHLPTGIIVSCQNERSQHLNRKSAYKMLASKLEQTAREKQEDDLKKRRIQQGEIAWSNQIRSYFLHPYTLVKDHRTDLEIHDAKTVLDGDIDQFIESCIRWLKTKEIKK